MSKERPIILEPPAGDPYLYRVRWYDHVGRKRQASYRAETEDDRGARKALADAQRKVDELIGKMQRGERTNLAKLTVDQMFDEWWENIVGGPKIGASTANTSYGPAFEHRILPYMGQATIASIDGETIDKFIGWMNRRGYSPQTIRNTITALSSMLKTAVKWKRIPYNPCHGVFEDIEVPGADRRAFELDEVYDIAAAMRFDRDRALVVVAAWIGQRKRDVYELRWEHVDTGPLELPEGYRASLRVWRRKSKKWATIPLFEPARLALLWWREITPHPGDDGLVFPSSAGTSLAKQSSAWYRRHWRPATARAGLVRCANASCQARVPEEDAERLALDPKRGAANLARWTERMAAHQRDPSKHGKPTGPRPTDPWECPKCGEHDVVGPVFHELRHTFGSHAVAATGDLMQVARWGGWSST
ncbi:MAG: integrase family protein, partial [Thermoleophilia bacterium]|nr:integrase family protein [Thermoleophilia bacterium]